MTTPVLAPPPLHAPKPNAHSTSPPIPPILAGPRISVNFASTIRSGRWFAEPLLVHAPCAPGSTRVDGLRAPARDARRHRRSREPSAHDGLGRGRLGRAARVALLLPAQGRRQRRPRSRPRSRLRASPCSYMRLHAPPCSCLLLHVAPGAPVRLRAPPGAFMRGHVTSPPVTRRVTSPTTRPPSPFSPFWARAPSPAAIAQVARVCGRGHGEVTRGFSRGKAGDLGNG